MKKLKKQNSVWSKMAGGARRAAAAVKKLGKNIRKVTNRGKGIGSLGDAIKGVTGKFALANIAASAVVGAFQAVSDSIGYVAQRAKDLAGVRKALQGFVSDQGQVEAIMDSTKATSMKYGVSVQSLEKAWARLGPAAQATGMNLAETNTVITAATARMARMGLNSEQAGRYMETLAQVMGKGKLQGEELNQQFAELDGALRAQLAAYFKSTKGIEDLSSAIQRGEIKAGDFAKALVSISKGDMESLAINLKNLQSEIDNLDPNQVQAVFSNLMDFAGQDMAAFFGPFIKELSKAGVAIAGFFAAFKTNYPELWAQSQKIWKGLGQFIGFVTKGLILLTHAVLKFQEGFVNMVKDFVAAAKKIPILGDVLGIVENASAAFGNALQEMGKDADAAIDSITKVDEVSKQNSIKKLAGEVDDFGTSADGAATKADKLKAAISKYQALKDKNEAFFTKESRRIKQVIKDLDKLKKDTNRMYDDRLKAAKRAQDAELKAMDKAKEGIEEQKKMSEELYDAQIEGIERANDAQQRKTENAISSLQKEKDQANRRYDAEIAQIEAAAQRAAAYHAQKLRELDKERAAAERAAEARLRKLDRAEAAAKRRSDKKIRGIEEEMGLRQTALDNELNAIQTAHEASMAAMEEQKNAYVGELQRRKAAIERIGQAELDSIQKTRDAAKRKHDDALRALDMQRDKISEMEAQQIGALEALTPAEQRLAEIRRERLQDTARDVNLSEEERLTARAALDDMDRQAAIQEVQRQAKEEQARLDEEQLSREEQHQSFLEQLAAAEKERSDTMKEQLDLIEGQINVAEQAYAAESAAAQELLAMKLAAAEQSGQAAITALEAELQKAQEVADRIDDRYEARRGRIEDELAKKMAAYDKEQEKIQETADQEQASHDQQIENIEDEKEANEQMIDDKVTKLEEEQKARDDLKNSIVQALNDEKKAQSGIYDQALKSLKDKRDAYKETTDAAIEGIKDEKEAFNRSVDDMKTAEQDRYDLLKQLHDDTKKRLDKLIDAEKELASGADTAAISINNQATSVNNLATSYNNLATSLSNVNRASAGAGGGSGTGGNALPTNFAGGPMKGGSRSHVNELGQEAFLSASGKLSLINAKPWEVWKAPADGTVIPAHLTSQLDIPRGGINLNQKAPAAAMQAPSSSRGLERALRTIQSAMGGNTTNNVTIQAANTTQAASDMLVSLNRIRHRRNT